MEKGSARKSKPKRLTDNVKQTARHIPHMSETALKRWYEARDTYLGHRQPPITRPRRIKPAKIKEPVLIISLESDQPPKIEIPIEEHEHVDDKCVGTEIDESLLFNQEIEQMDEATQADLPSPPVELQQPEEKEEIQIDQQGIEYDDKATETETDLIIDAKEDENEIDRQSPEEITVEPKPIADEPIEPIHVEETKTILSPRKSEGSIHEQLRRYVYFIFICKNLMISDYDIVSNDHQKNVDY
jgi:hypothetical protein